MKTDAILLNWRYHEHSFGMNISGLIFDDSKERFPDGRFVFTSKIVSGELKEGGFVKTENTVYLLGWEGE